MTEAKAPDTKATSPHPFAQLVNAENKLEAWGNLVASYFEPTSKSQDEISIKLSGAHGKFVVSAKNEAHPDTFDGYHVWYQPDGLDRFSVKCRDLGDVFIEVEIDPALVALPDVESKSEYRRFAFVWATRGGGMCDRDRVHGLRISRLDQLRDAMVGACYRAGLPMPKFKKTTT